MRRIHPARGVSALEFALLLPLLVMLPAALWDLGRALTQHERLNHAVRAAARHLATGDANDTTRQLEARNLAVYGRMDGAGTPIVPNLTPGMVKILEPQSTRGVELVATAAGPVSLVTVSISGVRFEPLLLPAAAFNFRTVSLTLAYRFT